ncbi:hypothetical protein Atai01_51810 [Amycolatopsis taiwanensis]|uniref:Uncharacterized protein n=1 Tax=Amycolatopsis taiwanensis TaxID=342230 RepID=A0A9W6R6R0_9PSEU|nr:hypothetical protein Atai01_51810 [Amycolatopsis taiwanensis]
MPGGFATAPPRKPPHGLELAQEAVSLVEDTGLLYSRGGGLVLVACLAGRWAGPGGVPGNVGGVVRRSVCVPKPELKHLNRGHARLDRELGCLGRGHARLDGEFGCLGRGHARCWRVPGSGR